MASTKIVHKNKSHILYDACVISKPGENLFNPEWLAQHAEIEQIGQAEDSQQQPGQQQIQMGRGAAWFVDYEDQQWVLRHYQRGGMVAHWNKQYYLGLSLAVTRAWREWYFLNTLFSLGLPVPQPIAACVSWPFGRLFCVYKAAIIINRIPHAMTLAEKCQQPLSLEAWQNVGRCIRKFHRHGVYHADLNANNILFDQDDKIYLIDFDKGSIRPDGAWKNENLNRLHRSLLKLQGLHGDFKFSEEDWLALIEAYKVDD